MAPGETYFIQDDINVACITAESFPEGIGAAWQKLFAAFPQQGARKFYGISYGGENGKIIYRAGAEELEKDEAGRMGLETFVIKKGGYVSARLEDWRKDETQIGKIFRELLQDPRVDKKEGYCVEAYSDPKDVLCLVKLAGAV